MEGDKSKGRKTGRRISREAGAMTEMSVHKSVLLNEILENLNLKKDSVIIDGTFGGGGHSEAICRTAPRAKIIALDQDASVWKRSKDKFKSLDCDISFENENFRNLDQVLVKKGLGKVSGVLLDLGLSSDQLASSGRGFSFLIEEPLLMTMKEDPRPEDLTAQDIVNSWEEKNLADIIYGYGEERYSRRIAKGIVEARKKKKIQTTFDLVKIIESSVPSSYKRGRIHPATKTFQALRIAVNDELGALEAGLKSGFGSLEVGGRMCVISFHSLEDRIVKNFFREKYKSKEARLMNKKPIVPSKQEILENPRSRSAKLRVLEKIK